MPRYLDGWLHVKSYVVHCWNTCWNTQKVRNEVGTGGAAAPSNKILVVSAK